jgi:hypothetical protein
MLDTSRSLVAVGSARYRGRAKDSAGGTQSGAQIAATRTFCTADRGSSRDPRLFVASDSPSSGLLDGAPMHATLTRRVCGATPIGMLGFSALRSRPNAFGNTAPTESCGCSAGRFPARKTGSGRRRSRRTRAARLVWNTTTPEFVVMAASFATANGAGVRSGLAPFGEGGIFKNLFKFPPSDASPMAKTPPTEPAGVTEQKNVLKISTGTGL